MHENCHREKRPGGKKEKGIGRLEARVVMIIDKLNSQPNLGG